MTSLREGRSPALAGIVSIAQGSTGDGSTQQEAVFLAPDVKGWFASPEQGLVADIEAAAGAGPVLDALARLAPSSITTVAVADSDDACWAEVTRTADGDTETCLMRLGYGSDGRVCRVVLLRAAFAPASEVAESRAAPDARRILERYFAALQDSRFGEAAAAFTPGTIYSHPPYGGGRERVLYRGRAALQRGFVIDRGSSPVRQVISTFSQHGDRAFVEGVIEGISNGGTFFSTAQITSGGEIARYVAFYSAIRLPGCS